MRVTSQHWEVLLNICEKDPNLITNKFNGAQGKAEGHALWANVASKLNGLGLGEKSVMEWRRAVTDWKSKVKAKASKLKQQATQTGGGSNDTPPLTPLEEKLISIMEKRGIEGDEGVKELGFPSRQTEAETSEQILKTPAAHSSDRPSPLSKYEETFPSWAGKCKYVFQEIDVNTEPTIIQQPPTFEQPFKNKRKHNTEEEHDYCTINAIEKKRGKKGLHNKCKSSKN